MPITPGPWIVLNNAKLAICQKKINLGISSPPSADTFKLILLGSTSNISKTMNPARYEDVTGELSTANGYTNGGASLSSPQLSGGGATAQITWDVANQVFTASGGSIGPARWAAIYDFSAGDKDLFAFCRLSDDDGSPDVTTPSGQTLTIAIINVFGLA